MSVSKKDFLVLLKNFTKSLIFTEIDLSFSRIRYLPVTKIIKFALEYILYF